jgi:hypothetical protein
VSQIGDFRRRRHWRAIVDDDDIELPNPLLFESGQYGSPQNAALSLKIGNDDR